MNRKGFKIKTKTTLDYRSTRSNLQVWCSSN